MSKTLKSDFRYDLDGMSAQECIDMLTELSSSSGVSLENIKFDIDVYLGYDSCSECDISLTRPNTPEEDDQDRLVEKEAAWWREKRQRAQYEELRKKYGNDERQT